METYLPSWAEFTDDLISEKLGALSSYIWRGHRKQDWYLEPALSRELRKRKNVTCGNVKGNTFDEHLEVFKYAVRGRIQKNLKELSDDELWSIGQHNSLATPLLDWTKSPYVALFFAFAKDDEKCGTEYRVVFGLNKKRINERAKVEKSTLGQ